MFIEGISIFYNSFIDIVFRSFWEIRLVLVDYIEVGNIVGISFLLGFY